jgi:uncharacterized protein YjcR
VSREGKCTARSKRRPGEPCGAWAVKGKDVCYHHGGASTGAPDRNKNAVTTGERETIWTDVLDETEQSILERNLDKLKLLEEEIGLLTIRERRMLARIKSLADDPDGMTLVEQTEEFSEDSHKSKAKRIGTLGQIQRIEEALTRVQAQKNRAIELKHKLEMDSGAADGGNIPTIRVVPPSGKTI